MAERSPTPLTVLRALDRYATKVFILKRDRSVSKSANQKLRTFSVLTAGDLGMDWGIREVSAQLDLAQRDPYRVVLRGAPLPGTDWSGTRRLKLDDPETGDKATFGGVPRRWIMVDLDKVSNAWGLDPRLADEAEELVTLIIARELPGEFQSVTCRYDWSSSTGMPARVPRPDEPPVPYEPPRVLGVHLWFALDRAIPDDDLRRWANDLKASGSHIDPGLFDAIQLHYVAPPICHGFPDPLGAHRSGLLVGEGDEVPLVLPPPKRATAPRRYTNGAGVAVSGVEGHLARIGGGGFHQPIKSALGAFFRQNGPDADDGPLRELIRDRVHAAVDADPARESDRVGYTSEGYFDGLARWFRTREASGERTNRSFEPGSTGTTTPGADTPVAPPKDPEQAAAELRAAIDAFLLSIDPVGLDLGETPPPVAGVRMPAGAGKTGVVLSRRQLLDLNVAFFSPEHRLNEELKRRLPPDGPRGVVAYGRARPNPHGEGTMCLKADLAEAVTALNGSVYSTLCRGRGLDGKIERCEFYDRCAYLRQFRNDGRAVRFLPHAYLSLPKPSGLPATDLGVIDERFWSTMLRGMNGRTFVPIARLADNLVKPARRGGINLAASSALSYPGQRAYRVLKAAIEAKRQPTPADFRAAKLTASDCRLIAGEWYGTVQGLQITPGMPAALQRKRLETARATEAFRMARFWRLLGDEIELERDRFHSLELVEEANGDGLPEHRVVMRWAAELAPWIEAAPILLLDADLDEEIAGRFLPGVRITTIAAERRGGHFTQIVDRPVSKSMLAYRGQDPAEVQRAANRRGDLRALIEVESAKLAPRPDGGPTTLVVTYYDVEAELRAAFDGRPGEDVLEDMRSGAIPQDGVLATRPDIALTHFNAIRGKDCWRGVSLAIVAGRPQPGVEELERMTRALFHKDPRPIDRIPPDEHGRVRYARELRPIRLADGGERCVPVDVHPDPLCARVLWQVREAELLQFLARPRLIWRDPGNPCRVILATNVPLPITVDRAATWNELMPNRFVRAFHRHPAMPLSDAELARCYPDLWTSDGAAKQDRLRQAEKGYESLIDILIGKRTPFPPHSGTYRRQGQRGRATPAVVRPVGRRSLRALLESVVGPVVEFKVMTPDLPQVAGAEPRVDPETFALAPVARPPAVADELWSVCGRPAHPAEPFPIIPGSCPDCGAPPPSLPPEARSRPVPCRACRHAHYDRLQREHPPPAAEVITIWPAAIAPTTRFFVPRVVTTRET